MASNTRGHVVPADAREATVATLAATPGLRGEPTDAERSRTLLHAGRIATLTTTAVDPAGTPYASLVGLAVDDGGAPLLCLSNLAEHSRNLVADQRASVLVTGPTDRPDPLAGARVTVLRRYREVHPGAFYAAFADFVMLRLDVVSARYVGGFGRMSWITAAELAAAEPDPLQPRTHRHLRRRAHHHGGHARCRPLNPGARRSRQYLSGARNPRQSRRPRFW